MFDRERLIWILDVLLSRGLIHEGQKKDVLNRGDDRARHIMLDKRAELRRLLGKRRVTYKVSRDRGGRLVPLPQPDDRR
ncbi:MAG: hypothetical protein IPO67_27185 [Deltaproteobacteria bacterium]|nr:hypothetical protein [Deltaproteobacteria bacterium]